MPKRQQCTQSESRAPAMCLVCGAVVCFQSYCCQQEINGETVGACTAHAIMCGAGSSIFLRSDNNPSFQNDVLILPCTNKSKPTVPLMPCVVLAHHCQFSCRAHDDIYIHFCVSFACYLYVEFIHVERLIKSG